MPTSSTGEQEGISRESPEPALRLPQLPLEPCPSRADESSEGHACFIALNFQRTLRKEVCKSAHPLGGV